MNLQIRAAQPEDAAGIVAIFNPIIESGLYTTFDTPFSVEAERQFIVSMPARAIFNVAVRRSDQRIVGFQSMGPFSSYSQAFDHVGVIGTFVDLTQRRRGIGAQLFAATFAAAKHRGYEKLFTYVRADNEAGLAAYLSQGFRIVGTAERHAKVRGKYIDEVVIERLL